MCHKWQSYDVSFFEIWSATDRIFYHLEPCFAIILSFYHFTQVYQKSWSWATLFLRYGTWRINCFLFWANFCTFNPSNSPKIFFLSKEHLEISSFLTYVPKCSDDVRFLRYGARQISSFLTYVPKCSDDVRFLRYGARQTNGKSAI